MNFTTTKALVPIQGLVPARNSFKRDTLCVDIYPGRFGNESAFSVYVLNDSEAEYGPDGRRRVKARYAEFLDVYA
ncbi:MAG: hypothetical protein LJE66_13440 [Desulfobacterales bacterium]|jgi:hypothetical protein|nr:hypothetical protein [Desulfobacterales bacterium]